MELSSFKFIQSVTPIACTSAIQRGFDLKRLAQHQISSGSSALILTPLKQQRVPLFLSVLQLMSRAMQYVRKDSEIMTKKNHLFYRNQDLPEVDLFERQSLFRLTGNF